MTDITSIVRLLVLLLFIALIVIIVTSRLNIPYTLGLVVVGLVISFFGLIPNVRLTPELVLIVFLPALLFEGAWSTETTYLRKNWVHIFLLAGPGLLIAVILIALALHFFGRLGWGPAFLLGAIVSPTDCVAVLGLLRHLKVDDNLSSIIEGESLFNDGVAGALYQIFLALTLLSVQGQAITAGQAWLDSIFMFLLVAGGGSLIGLVGGFLVSRLVRVIDDPLIETTLTIVTAYGIYVLADTLHTSGILAVVLAALVLGSYGRRIGMSERTSEDVDNFWSVLAFIANALLFLLVGAELNPARLFSTTSALPLLITAGLAVIAVLLSRLIVVLMLPSVTQPLIAQTQWSFVPPSWRVVIFWSGLRGALSIALVLALPLNVPSHDALIASTYAVVFFTLLVQGFSLRFFLRRLPSLSK